MKESYKTRLHAIKQCIFDMDGVFTSGKALVIETGQLARHINLKDAFAVQHATKNGLNIALISRGNDPAFKALLQRLGVQDVYMGYYEKLEALADLRLQYGWQQDQMLYMGDDIPDLDVMAEVGVSCCPYDAVPEVSKRADYISHQAGGEGCVRDILEQVLKIQQKWPF